MGRGAGLDPQRDLIRNRSPSAERDAKTGSAVLELAQSSTGLLEVNIPDRMRRYQHVLALLPAAQVDGVFQDGVIDNRAGDTILDCWAST